MIIPRHPIIPTNPPKLDRILKNHASTQRPNLLPKNLLPRRLTAYLFIASFIHQLLPPLLDFAIGELDVDGALGEVDPDDVAVAQDGEVTVLSGFGTGVEDGGGGRGAGLATVAGGGLVGRVDVGWGC